MPVVAALPAIAMGATAAAGVATTVKAIQGPGGGGGTRVVQAPGSAGSGGNFVGNWLDEQTNESLAIGGIAGLALILVLAKR